MSRTAQAAPATALLAHGALHQARVAVVVVANRTASHAIVAAVLTAAFAAANIVLGSAAATFMAGAIAPVFQLHVGAACVVLLQHRPHQAEGIGQSSLLERPLDGGTGVAGAQTAIADVGMCNVLLS